MEKQEFLYHLSLLHDKILQVQPLVQLLQCSPQAPTQQGPIASKIGSIMHEVVMAASSMVIMSHAIDMGSSTPPKSTHPTPMPRGHGHDANHHESHHDGHEWVMMDENAHMDAHLHGLSLDIFSDPIPQSSQGDDDCLRLSGHQAGPLDTTPPGGIIEMSPAEILAEFTHYCHLCGKGFKRGANLRMHMRAHGDEYKTNAALVRPKGNPSGLGEGQDPLVGVARKYSCPHEGCRWNKNHAKFQPLKSSVYVRNHYKRSHCPKVYMCKRCNSKRFSLLADLRTHEKHCGDVKWQCSPGTSFSRKDKLLGHVTLFKSHIPFVRCSFWGNKKLEN